MDFIKSIGGSISAGLVLTADEKPIYERIKAAIDRATNDIFTRPDIGANIDCVDLVNETTSVNVLTETISLMKRKISHSNPDIVYLSLHLCETLVKNGKESFYLYINEESFMKELARVARKYNTMTGSRNKDISELVLDMIQGWGETFLPYTSKYPNIVRTYQDLRRENMPFKPQYDTSRVPIITPRPTTTTTTTTSTHNATTTHTTHATTNRYTPNEYQSRLNRTASSVNSNSNSNSNSTINSNASTSSNPRRFSGSNNETNRSEPTRATITSSSRTTAAPARPTTTTTTTTAAAGAAGRAPSDFNPDVKSVLASLDTLRAVLIDIILASQSQQELISDETAAELAGNLRELINQLAVGMERYVETHPSEIENLFKLNEESIAVLSSYDNILNGSSSLGKEKASFAFESSNSNKAKQAQDKDQPVLIDFESDSDYISSSSSNSSSSSSSSHDQSQKSSIYSIAKPPQSSNNIFYSDPFAPAQFASGDNNSKSYAASAPQDPFDELLSIASRPHNNTIDSSTTSSISAFTLNQPPPPPPAPAPAALVSSMNFPATMPLSAIPQAAGYHMPYHNNMQTQSNYPSGNMMYTNNTNTISNNPSSVPPQNYQYPPNMPLQFSNTTPIFPNNMPSSNYKISGIQMNNEMIPNTTTTTNNNNNNLINGPNLVPGQQNVQNNPQDTNPFDIF